MKRSCLALMALIVVIGSVPARAQIPREFTNLQVLDEDIEFRELVGIMRQFAGALGVRCTFCHPGEVEGSLEGVDFASDEKHEKVAAREMLRLTASINETVRSKIAEDGENAVRVKCITCHRGQVHPYLTSDVLDEAYEESGVEAAKTKYTELREKYYGTHTYDFSEFVLTSMAEDLARDSKLDDAVALLQLNLEFSPDSSYTWGMLGQVRAQSGDVEGAKAALQKALELDPENDHIQRMLERLGE